MPVFPEFGGRVVEVGVDWLTCTARKGNPSARALCELAATLAALERQEGEAEEEYRAEGFRGAKCGGVRYGERTEDVLLSLSGPIAHEHWQEAVPLADNLSRLDLEVTTLLEQPDMRVHLKGLKLFERWRDGRAGRRPRGTPPKGGVQHMIPWGATLMLGTRVSDVYLRAYDKGAQRKDYGVAPPTAHRGAWEPGYWWRYEAELKRKVARDTAQRLLRSEDPAAAVRGMVAEEFERKGVRPRYKAHHPAEIVRTPRDPTNDDRRLRYTRDVVVPMFAGLRDRGRGDDLLRELAAGLGGPE